MKEIFKTLDKRLFAYEIAGRNPKCAMKLAQKQGLNTKGMSAIEVQEHYKRTRETIIRGRKQVEEKRLKNERVH